MNYDIWSIERLCSSPEELVGVNETHSARRRGAASSEGLLYMNYDDAAAPTAVISL